jgi:hypothetical protein
VTKKLWLVFLIVAFTIANILVLTAIWPIINSNVAVAANDSVIISGNHAASFAAYRWTISALPWFLYLIAPVIGVIEVILVLKGAEYAQNRWLAR